MPTTTAAIDLAKAQAIAEKFSGARAFQRDEVGLVGRETELYVAEVAIIAKLHIILHGSPGVAKSMTIDGLAAHLPDLNKFKTQAYKASPPEQFLGPVSIKGMEHDKFVRIVKGKLPDVELAIIDELARAPRAVLPAFQGMMVEREFDSGDGVMPVPLTSLIGTVNHLPDDPELEAFLDRFALKLIVKGPSSQDEFVRIMELALRRREHGVPTIPDELRIAGYELHAFQRFVEQVQVPGELLIGLGEIWANLLAEGIAPSTRRYVDATKAMQAVALLDGRDECMLDDLQIAQHVLWTTEEEAPRVYAEVVAHASEWVKQKAELMDSFQEILDRLGQVQSLVAGGADTTAKVEIKDAEGEPIVDPSGANLSITDHAIKLVNEQRKLSELIERHQSEAAGRDTADLDAVISQIDGARQWVTDRIMGGLAI